MENKDMQKWLKMYDQTAQDTILKAAAIACEATTELEECVLFSEIARAHFYNYCEGAEKEKKKDNPRSSNKKIEK